MNDLFGFALLLALLIAITRTQRPYTILWTFATPIFYIIFGAKSIFINLGFTEVELFSGVLPMAVCLITWSKLSKTERRRAWKYSPKLWWLFLAYYFASLFWSDNISTGVRTVLEIALPSILYLVAFNVIQNDFHIKRYYQFMMIINVIVAIFDLYTAMTGWDTIKYAGAMNDGAIGYRTVVAYFYVTMGTILMMRMMEKFEWKIAVLYIVDVLLLLLAASRTPTLAFIAGSLIAIVYRRNVQFTIIGVVVMAILVGLILILPTRHKFIAGDSVNMSDSGRGFFQKYFEDKADESPIWGFGAGGSETYASWLCAHITLVGAPHNEYLRIRFDGGNVGLYLFYLGLVDIFVRGLMWGRGVKHYFPLKAILIMTPVMFAVSCTNDNTFFYFYVFTQYLFVFMGFGARICYEARVLEGKEVIVMGEEEIEKLKEQMGLVPAT